VALAAVLVVGLVAACQAQPLGSSCARSVAPTGATGGCAPIEAPTDSASTSAPPPSPTPDANLPAEIDATLLAYLPESVADATLREDVDEAAIAVADPNLSRVATALDVGVALDESSANLVTAHVVRLREGAFDDAAYRDWRDTFDEGACAAGGGVKGRAETTIDGRTVYVTTCVTALRTYHLWIGDEELLVSAASIGDGNFGELLMNELRVP
jgi:hypothetical protein